MASTEVQVSVEIRTEVSESVANGCLKIVEMYLNKHPDKKVIPCHYDDGELCLELVSEDEIDEDDEDE